MHQRAAGKLRRRLTASATIFGAALACVAAAPAAADAAPPLVGEWRFDENAGQTAFDGSSNGLDGRLGASADVDAADPARIAGLSGGALRFDGSSSVRLPDRRELDVQHLTAEAVLRAPASPGAHRYVMSRGAQGCYAGSYGLYTGADGGIAVYVFDGSRYVVSATARPSDIWDGSWHHVAGTFDGSTMRLYVDGRPVGTPTSAPLRIDYAGTSSGAYFGRFVGDCDLAFRGDVDLARLWSGALYAGQVAHQAASELGSGSGAPGTPLPGATPGTTLPGPSGSSAPSRSCVLRLSRTRVATARPTVVRVRVGSQGSPVRAARVTARRKGGARILAAARTNTRGRVRLVLDVKRAGRLRISAATPSPRCKAAFVDVRKAG